METARNQRHILDSDLHSLLAQQRQALDPNNKRYHLAADCPLRIMRAYLSVWIATAGPLFLYCPSVPVTRANFNEQLRGALQFYHFCPKQFKSHSFRIGAATTAAAQGMSESQIRSLGRRSWDAFMKYIVTMFTEGVCSMNYHRVLAWLIARPSEQEVRVGPK